MHYPLGDTRKLREEFGFALCLQSADAVADMTDWSSSKWTVGTRSVRKPIRLAEPVVFPRDTSGADGSAVRIVPPEYTGEFDNVTGDPGVARVERGESVRGVPGSDDTVLARPGEPHHVQLRRTCSTISFRSDRELMRMVSTKQVGTIGHRFYNNMTVMKELAKAIPGQTPESFEHQMNGTPLPDGYRAPRMSAADALAGARAACQGRPADRRARARGVRHGAASRAVGRRPPRPASALRPQTAGPHRADHRHGGAGVGHQLHEHVRGQSPHEPHRAALRRRRRDECAHRDPESAQRRPARRACASSPTSSRPTTVCAG